MFFSEVKQKLLSFYDNGKLEAKPDEWGFLNENCRNIRRIGYAVNLTPGVVSDAAGLNIDLLVTHHDAWKFLYGMKERCNELLAQNNITHAFFHLPLDDADFGASASLANALGLKRHRKAILYEKMYFVAVIGELEKEIAFEHLLKRLSNILEEPIRSYKNNDKSARKICVAAGAGFMTDNIKAAADRGCDAYITGEYNLYAQLYAEFAGINLLVGSHTNTELLGVKNMLTKLIDGTDMEMFYISEKNY